jgi:hypothetical protein
LLSLLMLRDQLSHQCRYCFAARDCFTVKAVVFRLREPDVQLLAALPFGNSSDDSTGSYEDEDGGGTKAVQLVITLATEGTNTAALWRIKGRRATPSGLGTAGLDTG